MKLCTLYQKQCCPDECDQLKRDGLPEDHECFYAKYFEEYCYAFCVNNYGIGKCRHELNTSEKSTKSNCPIVKGPFFYFQQMCSIRGGICPDGLDGECGTCEERKRIKRSKSLK